MPNKLSVLYIAYSCSPLDGSEDRVGWRICEEASKLHNVYVLTKAESKNAINAYKSKHSIENIIFYYVDIPPIYKRLFNGVLYSARLNIWHQKAVAVAKHICKENPSINIIHQITPVEFRSIGNYASIEGVKFICGPIGGGEYCPDGLKRYIRKHWHIEMLRKATNMFYRSLYKLNGRFKTCSCIMCANHETKEYIGIKNAIVETELGIDKINEFSSHSTINNDNKCVFLVAGRGIYRKGHIFLFDAVKQLQTNKNYTIKIIGEGPEIEKLKKYYSTDDRLKKHFVCLGKIPYSEMQKEYKQADVLIMPSIRETTGSVMFEALYNGIPVIAMNQFGSGIIINDHLGWTFEGNIHQEYIDSLTNKIKLCIENPKEILEKKQNIAFELNRYTWDTKIQRWTELYNSILSQ